MRRLADFGQHLGRFGVPAALVLLALMVWPGTRHFLQASMTLHMLVQYPLLMLCGALLAGRLAARPQRATTSNGWNAHGIAGLLATALILAILMIPRVLDLALVSAWAEAAKVLALLVGGAALRLSWQAAGWLVQGFFLGQVLPMMAVVGTLYESSPVRVCNAYLLDDQALLGQLLVWLAAAVALLWFAALAYSMARQEHKQLAETAETAQATESLS